MGDFSQTMTIEFDYGQGYLTWEAEASGIFDPAGIGTVLAYRCQPSAILLMGVRQSGPIDIAVRIDSAAPALAPEWADVAELSFTPTEPVRLVGWGEFDGPVVPLDVGTTYRMRWAIAEADRANETWEPPFPERYRLDFWPQAESAPSLLIGSKVIGVYAEQDTYHPQR